MSDFDLHELITGAACPYSLLRTNFSNVVQEALSFYRSAIYSESLPSVGDIAVAASRDGRFSHDAEDPLRVLAPIVAFMADS